MISKEGRSIIYNGALIRIESRVSSNYADGVIVTPWEADAIAHEVYDILRGKVVPLYGEVLIRAALRMCSEIGNENVAVVMYKSENMEDNDWVGLYLSDVEEFEASRENFFSADIQAQLWLGEAE